jgi:NAD(P)-dependent dehydrogenase (short-subunit alcohol dehydrogenase family)
LPEISRGNASKGFSSNSVYSATKAAVRSFARTWTTDLKNRRIRVNAVSPGSIDTPGLSDDLLASSETGEHRKTMIFILVGAVARGSPAPDADDGGLLEGRGVHDMLLLWDDGSRDWLD